MLPIGELSGAPQRATEPRLLDHNVWMRALLAALQCTKSGPSENLSSHLGLVGEAAATGCDLALFLEMSLTGSVDPARNPERLVSLDHKAVFQLVRASDETGVGICFGVAEGSSDGRAHIAQVFAAGATSSASSESDTSATERNHSLPLQSPLPSSSQASQWAWPSAPSQASTRRSTRRLSREHSSFSFRPLPASMVVERMRTLGGLGSLGGRESASGRPPATRAVLASGLPCPRKLVRPSMRIFQGLQLL